MQITFEPVPAEDREKGRNSNCYNAGHPLTDGMKRQFIEEIKPICIEMERKYGIPAAFLGGQAVNESGYGLTRTGYFASNFCGLKFVGAWGRKPPQVLDGTDFGVQTYQLTGQPDEAWDSSVKAVENLGEDRLIFDEAIRYDNRYFKFHSKYEFFDFLCRIVYLNESNKKLYPRELNYIFEQYQHDIQQGKDVRGACSAVARKLGESGYCHVQEGTGTSEQRRGNYYSRVVTEAMDKWHTYEWTQEAIALGPISSKLEAIADTFFKKTTEQASKLQPNEKVFIEAGRTLEYWRSRLQVVDEHYRVELREPITAWENIGFLYKPHIKL